MHVFDKIRFGQSIKTLRNSKSLNQIEFAKSVDVGNGSLSEIEQGKRVAGIDFLFSVCREYQVNADEMIGLTDKKNVSKDSRTYEEGYNDCKKENELNIERLNAKVEALSDILIKLITEVPHHHHEQDSEVQSITKFTDINSIESEVEINNIPIVQRKAQNATPLKAAATPITGRTNDNDQP